MFDACRRRYYYHYYLSWNGWSTNAPAVVQEAFKLKRLVSLPLWRGQLVHYVASKVLQSMRAKGRIPDPRKVAEYTDERFEQQLAFSEAKRYLTEPKKHRGRLNIDWLALFEHEYGRPLDPARISRTRNECKSAIETLLSNSILPRALDSDPSGWVIEDLDRAEFSQNFIFNGATVYVKTDFIFREPDGTFIIVDWKTTRERCGRDATARGAAVQLGVYGYYASTVLGIPVNDIRLYEVNLLGGGALTEHTIRAESIELFRRHITAGITELSGVLVDADRERNEPGPIDRFPKIENGACRSCNFYRICKDENYNLFIK
jgi:hypothetical protein